MIRGKKDYITAINTFVEKMENQKVQADIFLHVWDEKEVFSPGGELTLQRRLPSSITSLMHPDEMKLDVFHSKYPALSNAFNVPYYEKLDHREFNDILNLKNAFVESQSDFHKRYSLDISPQLMHMENLNQMNMLYKIFSAFHLARAYQEKNKFKYDAVIRLRPDMVVNGFNCSDFFKMQSYVGDNNFKNPRQTLCWRGLTKFLSTCLNASNPNRNNDFSGR